MFAGGRGVGDWAGGSGWRENERTVMEEEVRSANVRVYLRVHGSVLP